jgi:hypothetical protein
MMFQSVAVSAQRFFVSWGIIAVVSINVMPINLAFILCLESASGTSQGDFSDRSLKRHLALAWPS